MKRNTNNYIKEIFHSVQFNKTCHQSNLKKLKKCYEQVRIGCNTDEFIIINLFLFKKVSI